ncbi:MAG: four-carbon acid sugar kinase family protein [Pseudonocardiaceae bacterium]|nr:four-carbon acid sugar kinase family protein [Pseudonocardiaceae bacterium]
MPRVLVVGDDLTGSNATGALFARFGMRTMSTSAPLDGPPNLLADALVVNLGTRHATAEQARARLRAAVTTIGQVGLLVKRVDTTLRGHVGAEADEALRTRQPGARALVVPAFPDAGRVTVGGLHLVDGVPLAETPAARDPMTPVSSSRVTTVLRAGTGSSIGELPLDVVESGVDGVASALAATDGAGHLPEMVVCDAMTNAHLTTIADAAARLSTRDGTDWVSVDSGPFGVRLAAALGIAPGDRDIPPVLAVVGSITELTRDQVLETEQVLSARYVDVPLDNPAPEPIAERVGELVKAGHRVVGVRTRQPDQPAVPDHAVADLIPGLLTDVTRLVLTEHRIGGLYATGGDIAAALTRGLDTEGFEIDTEVLPLAVAGHLVGGPFTGMPFATKGGLIGSRSAAVDCIKHLGSAIARQQKAVRQQGRAGERMAGNDR